MLFASAVFNSRMFNGGVTIATVHSTDRLVFEDFSLADGSSMIMTDLLDSGPTTDLVSGDIPRGDGRYVTARYLREKTIEARGIAKQSTAALLDAYLDTIRKSLRYREGNLDVTDAVGTAKRYVATLDNFEDLFADRERHHITICPWRARFRCLVPFGKSRTYTSSSLSITTSPSTQSVYHEGTYDAQPVVTLIFDAASSVTAVSVANGTTGETITYTGSIATNDVLSFDSERKQVLKNSSAVTFTGAFLSLPPGGSLITVTITGTSFTAYTTYSHRTTYL